MGEQPKHGIPSAPSSRASSWSYEGLPLSESATTALLTEHFRYTPLTLLDDVINTVNELVFRAINAIEEGFAGTTAEQLGFELDKDTARSFKTDAARQDALAELKTNEIDNGIVKL